MDGHFRERRRCLDILGLPLSASEDDIKKAYKNLARQLHPDKNKSEDAKEKFQEMQGAYKYLTEGPSVLEHDDDDDDSFGIPLYVFMRLFPWLNPHLFTYEDEDSSCDDDEEASFFYGIPPSFYLGRSAPAAARQSPRQSPRQAPRQTPPRGQARPSPSWASPPREAQSSESPGRERSWASSTPTRQPERPATKGQKKRLAKQRKRAEQKRSKEEEAAKKKSEASSTNTKDDKVDVDDNKSSQGGNSGPADKPAEQTSSSGEQKQSETPTSGAQTKVEEQQQQATRKKKSAKQMKEEQRRREQEMAEVGKDLQERMEREREKKAKKEAARKEREQREAEERQQQEEREIAEAAQRMREEQRLREEEAAKKRQKEEEEKMKMRLMAEFDDGLYLDAKGDFITKEAIGIGGIKKPDPYPNGDKSDFIEEPKYIQHTSENYREYNGRGRGFPDSRNRGYTRNPQGGQNRGGYRPAYEDNNYNPYPNQNGRGRGGLLPSPSFFDGRANNPSKHYSGPYHNQDFNERGYNMRGNDEGRFGPQDFISRGGRGQRNWRGRGQRGRGRGDRGRGGSFDQGRRNSPGQGREGYDPSGDDNQNNQNTRFSPEGSGRGGRATFSPPPSDPKLSHPSQENPNPPDRNRGPESRGPGTQAYNSSLPNQHPVMSTPSQGQPPFDGQFVGGQPPRPLSNPPFFQPPTPLQPLRPLLSNKNGNGVRNQGPPPDRQFPPGFQGPPPSGPSQPFFQQRGPTFPAQGLRGPHPNTMHRPSTQSHPQSMPQPDFHPPMDRGPGQFNGPQSGPQPSFRSGPRPPFGSQPAFGPQPSFNTQPRFTSQPRPSVPFIARMGAPGMGGPRPYIPPFGNVQLNDKMRNAPAAPAADSRRAPSRYECTVSEGRQYSARKDTKSSGNNYQAANDNFGLDDIDD